MVKNTSNKNATAFPRKLKSICSLKKIKVPLTALVLLGDFRDRQAN